MPETDTQIKFVSAVSAEDAVGDALDEAVGEAAAQLGDRRADLVIVFASYHHRGVFSTISRRIEQELDPQVALGTTAQGVIGSGVELEEQPGLAVLAASLPGAWLYPFSYQNLDWPGSREDPRRLRSRLVGEANLNDDPKLVLMLADPFSTPMIKLMPAMNEAMAGTPIVGGMASGGGSPGDNRMLLNERVSREGAVGVAIGGDLRVDCTVSQGCRPIGEPWVITRAKHNIIQEVAQKPVMQAIQETAAAAEPADRQLLQESGLLVGRVINEYKDRFGRGDFLVRNIIGADQESGYIAVSDLVKVGQTIQFHVRDRRTAEEDLRLLLESQQLHGPAAGALLCTCNGRGARLFGRPNAESQLIHDRLGAVPMAGFFAAGEIGPIGGENFVHGFTASLAVFRDAQPTDES